MIKIFVDSGSSIRQLNAEKFNVEILPLKILMGDVEYSDGVDLSMENFYNILINDGIFPKTSLPNLDDAFNRVNKFVDDGYEVIIITISSGISGTFNALKMLFSGNPKVRVIDSLNAVGGVQILVKEANKYLDKSLDFVEEKLSSLAKRITTLAVPETLDYLRKGGRLSATGYAAGKLLHIKPIILLNNTVSVASKTIGIKSAMKYLVKSLEDCDVNYPIIPSYTYNDDNLNELISKTPSEYVNVMTEKDNIAPAIACHWGPNAFGYIYVEKGE